MFKFNGNHITLNVDGPIHRASDNSIVNLITLPISYVILNIRKNYFGLDHSKLNEIKYPTQSEESNPNKKNKIIQIIFIPNFTFYILDTEVKKLIGINYLIYIASYDLVKYNEILSSKL